jgi:hypothetical protein
MVVQGLLDGLRVVGLAVALGLVGRFGDVNYRGTYGKFHLRKARSKKAENKRQKYTTHKNLVSYYNSLQIYMIICRRALRYWPEIAKNALSNEKSADTHNAPG